MPEILIPKFDSLTPGRQRRMERELRFGQAIDQYISRERSDTKQRMLRAALPHKNARRQFGEFKLTGVIDARTYFRWLQTDPHFFEDKGNWDRFVKDNPEVQPWRP